MTEIKTTGGKLLFSYDEKITTLKEEIVKRKHLTLRFADLKGANLSGVDLRNVNLNRANLQGADLRGADLFGADLFSANLRNANLNGADLGGAVLFDANLRNANLIMANLRMANLRHADLYHADLRDASLISADLGWANLNGADFRCTDIRHVNLSKAKNVPEGLPMTCPAEGSFIAWKKVNDDYIIKLEIPSDAKRSSATSGKCRCDRAMVLEITNIYTGEKVDEVVNKNYVPCTYKTGEMVYPDSFDEDRWQECSHGIHFFTTKEEAVNYYY